MGSFVELLLFAPHSPMGIPWAVVNVAQPSAAQSAPN